MTLDATFRMDGLSLYNFRSFEKCAIEFHPKLTVLVAENGQGKTSLLDAIAIALNSFVEGVLDKRQQVDIKDSDIRRYLNGKSGTIIVADQAEIIAEAQLFGKAVAWKRTRQFNGPRPSRKTKDTKDLYNTIQNVRQVIEENGKEVYVLPLVAFYRADRFMRETKWNNREMWWGDTDWKDAYLASIPSGSSLEGILSWYTRKWTQLNDPAFGTNLEYLLSVVQVVEAVIQETLKPTGWSNLVWSKGELYIHHPEKVQLPPLFLSDGVKTILSLVMDIVRRCFVLNPHLQENTIRETPGVLLIDEIDLHLHPRWQQVVLQSLTEVFPLIQFVVTTHSPQVITTVPSECIRIISDGSLHAAPPGTDGAESQRVLEDVFGVSARPETEMSHNLHEYLRLVDNREWESPRALELRRKLDEWSQGTEPRLVEADLQIENMKWEDEL